MKRFIVAGAAAGLVSLAACTPPPQTSSIAVCKNGTAQPVKVIPGTVCPKNGWNVLDPAEGGTTQQGFPYGKALVGTDPDNAGVTYLRTYYVRNANGSLSTRTFVYVTGPKWMVATVAVETVDGFALDSHVMAQP